MDWPLMIVIGLLAAWILSESTVLLKPLAEGFVAPMTHPARSDIGLSSDGWGEDVGFERDLRFTEGHVDLNGAGRPIDFCRAIQRKGRPETRRIACALGTRDGMSTREWSGPTTADGFRWSRDDYWRPADPATKTKAAYCRILKDADTGEYASFCAPVAADGFRKGPEERDTEPPPTIRELLHAYDGGLVWWRWADDDGDYVSNAVYEIHGSPTPPSEGAPLKATATRGFQFNRWSPAAQAAAERAPPVKDYLRWGEVGGLTLDQGIPPREIRAFAAWIYWDAIEAGAAIWESSNGGNREMVRLFAEGGGPALGPAGPPEPQGTEPVGAVGHLTGGTEPHRSQSAAYVWEIWDTEGRLTRLETPPGSLKAGRWQHVVVTTADRVAWWPRWQLWLDGALVAEKADGRSIPAMTLAQNWLGRGFRGCIQDVRLYNRPMTAEDIAIAKKWSGARLHPVP